MKYFTKEFWLRLQNVSDSWANDQEWEQLLVAYRNNLSVLCERLRAASMAFFEDADVHDGHLVEFRVSQPVTTQSWDGAPETEHPVNVQLVVREKHSTRTWVLKYSTVRSVVVDYPSRHPLFPIGGEGFGDWGYHELTDAGDGFLRHEVLFATGATLLVEFGDIEVEQAEARTGAV
jgi:hypothetical protein